MTASIQVEINALDNATEVTIKAPLRRQGLPSRLVLRIELDTDGRVPGEDVKAPATHYISGAIFPDVKTFRDLESFLDSLDLKRMNLGSKRDDNSHNDSSVDSSGTTPETPTVGTDKTPHGESDEDGAVRP